MARKSAKDLSLLKRGLIKSCLGGAMPAKARNKGGDRDDAGDDRGQRREKPKAPAKPLGHADAVARR